ncbi:phosphate transporter [Escherichia coli]|nr:phosphate transporter [Escherichia coli]OWC83838.1 phosphate transporter [Escherichia coli]
MLNLFVGLDIYTGLLLLLALAFVLFYEAINGFHDTAGNDSNLLIVFYVQIMPDDFVMQLHRF